MRRVADAAHFLWGMMIALVSVLFPPPASTVLPVLMFVGFIVYELDEDWHLSDKAFQDILEMMLGLAAGVILDAAILAAMWVKGLEPAELLKLVLQVLG